MKRRLWVATALACCLLAPAGHADKPKPAKGQVVDSGSFGVFVNGKRVATEKFSIEQRADMSVATSEIQIDDGGSKLTQNSELQLAPSGDLLRYTWHDGGNKTQAVVEPSNEFLVEHVTTTANTKSEDTPFLMPHSTVILDDYFFSHRQLLAWRYMASVCAPNAQGKVDCNLARTQFGVLVPQQRVSFQVALEFAGKEKVKVRGAERELSRINLHSEEEEWSLWLDDANKLVRITITGANTEVVRD